MQKNSKKDHEKEKNRVDLHSRLELLSKKITNSKSEETINETIENIKHQKLKPKQIIKFYYDYLYYLIKDKTEFTNFFWEGIAIGKMDVDLNFRLSPQHLTSWISIFEKTSFKTHEQKITFSEIKKFIRLNSLLKSDLNKYKLPKSGFNDLTNTVMLSQNRDELNSIIYLMKEKLLDILLMVHGVSNNQKEPYCHHGKDAKSQYNNLDTDEELQRFHGEDPKMTSYLIEQNFLETIDKKENSAIEFEQGELEIFNKKVSKLKNLSLAEKDITSFLKIDYPIEIEGKIYRFNDNKRNENIALAGFNEMSYFSKYFLRLGFKTQNHSQIYIKNEVFFYALKYIQGLFSTRKILEFMTHKNAKERMIYLKRYKKPRSGIDPGSWFDQNSQIKIDDLKDVLSLSNSKSIQNDAFKPGSVLKFGKNRNYVTTMSAISWLKDDKRKNRYHDLLNLTEFMERPLTLNMLLNPWQN